MNAKQFRNALAILRSIDHDELCKVGIQLEEADWHRFNRDPYRFYLASNDERQAKLWALIESRQPKVDLSVPLVPELAETPQPLGIDQGETSEVGAPADAPAIASNPDKLPDNLRWKGDGPPPARWTSSDGTIVYRSYADYVDG